MIKTEITNEIEDKKGGYILSAWTIGEEEHFISIRMPIGMVSLYFQSDEGVDNIAQFINRFNDLVQKV